MKLQLLRPSKSLLVFRTSVPRPFGSFRGFRSPSRSRFHTHLRDSASKYGMTHVLGLLRLHSSLGMPALRLKPKSCSSSVDCEGAHLAELDESPGEGISSKMVVAQMDSLLSFSIESKAWGKKVLIDEFNSYILKVCQRRRSSSDPRSVGIGCIKDELTLSPTTCRDESQVMKLHNQQPVPGIVIYKRTVHCECHLRYSLKMVFSEHLRRKLGIEKGSPVMHAVSKSLRAEFQEQNPLPTEAQYSLIN
ncbi:hypothetical protein AXG93_1774s1260 [Marchantia polymorpha subsp. ruderalis]|uniref:Uncharacterized protein n=1 Tax=Marchantia polymorpha subsp. ruderalis TaxID=1480154 RepID=A0A176W497_MARPO|nr:hypothetical protein AXG93_1774s1260 [Marchantia polymorpha subsp. ruderalis]